MEGLPSELDYFEPSLLQSSIVEEYDIDKGPSATLSDGQPIDFSFPGSSTQFVDLNNSKFEFKIKITKANGSEIDNENDSVGPINLLFHSLFSMVEMEIGDKKVTDPTTNYAYRSLFETIINVPKHTLNTRLLSEGWYKDTAGKLNITDPTGENLGLKERTSWFASGKSKTFIGRPHLDLFHQDKLIPSMIPLKFRFIPNKDSWILKTKSPGGSQQNYKISISSAKMYLHIKEISSSLQLAHQKMLQTSNYKIPYNRVLTKTLTLAKGLTYFEQDNLYSGQLPDLILLAMVADHDMAGGYQKNPFHFQHFNMSYLALKVNGEKVPYIPHQPDFANDDYIRSYINVLENLGYDIGPNCWDLKPEEWATGYNIYAFKITPGPIGNIRSPPKNGSIGLALKFAAPPSQNINILLLSQEPAELQIDKYFHVITA